MPCRSRTFATLLCLLGLWLQLLAPALASTMPRNAFDPLSAICHSPSDTNREHRPAPTPHAPACDHCLLCHAVASGLLPDGRPVFTRFDYPVSSPSRWVAATPIGSLVDLRRIPHPRGPPTTV